MTLDYSSSPRPVGGPDGPITGVQWLTCIISAIGFSFDTYVLLMLPLVIRPAMMELGGIRPGTPQFSHWFALLLYVPAVAGGVFGLLGGYLTDRLGRRRVLTWSILIYAISALLSGFSTSLLMLLILRTTMFIGVCVEFVAAVAWLAELFQNPARREKVLGYTQAFGSLGGAMVAWANSICLHINPDKGWRYTLISGLIPAIPLILVRPFLPESPVWREKKAAGTLRRPSIAALFSPQLRRTTIVSTIMFACSLGAAFGAIQQMPQIVPGLPEVQAKIRAQVAALPPAPAKGANGAKGAKGAAPTGGPASAPGTSRPTAAPAGDASAPTPARVTGAPAVPGEVTASAKAVAAATDDPRVKQATGRIVQETAAEVAKLQEYGGLLGRIILAILVVLIVSRRTLIRVFQIPGLIVMPIVFGYAAIHGVDMLKMGMFAAGLFTVAQFSFWGNYLPTVYPVHLRGTGESFAANIGGRMIGTAFGALTALLAAKVTPPRSTPAVAAHYWAYTAAGVGVATYAIGLICSFFLPEPPREVMPE